eukprot:COSAG04_NODE_25072_length_312_cov_0.967136_1_plen_58_part_10
MNNIHFECFILHHPLPPNKTPNNTTKNVINPTITLATPTETSPVRRESADQASAKELT